MALDGVTQIRPVAHPCFDSGRFFQAALMAPVGRHAEQATGLQEGAGAFQGTTCVVGDGGDGFIAPWQIPEVKKHRGGGARLCMGEVAKVLRMVAEHQLDALDKAS